MYILNFEDIKK